MRKVGLDISTCTSSILAFKKHCEKLILVCSIVECDHITRPIIIIRGHCCLLFFNPA